MDLEIPPRKIKNLTESNPLKPGSVLGAKYCTPEIDTSEIIVDFQCHFPMDFQWHFPTTCHLSVLFPKGLSLVQWICTGNVQWIPVTFSNGFLLDLVCNLMILLIILIMILISCPDFVNGPRADRGCGLRRSRRPCRRLRSAELAVGSVPA